MMFYKLVIYQSIFSHEYFKLCFSFQLHIEGSVQGVMAYTGTLLIIQSFLTILADASECIIGTQNHAFDGWSCQPFGHRDITNVPYHHCSLTCIQSLEWQAFIYNKQEWLCMMLNKPCVWTQPYAGHIYGISKPQCFTWENHDKPYPFYWYYEGAHKNYVGRRLLHGDLLIGKVTGSFHTVDPNSFSLVSGGSYETLVVDPSCKVSWLPYDANSGQPLPYDALIGGTLSTTNTPLYVARQLQGTIYITGYYNPLNNKAWGPSWSSGPLILNSTVFEVMAVKRWWRCWLIRRTIVLKVRFIFVIWWKPKNDRTSCC